MKYKISSDYAGDGPPRWTVSEVLHVTPGDEFARTVNQEVDRLMAATPRTDQSTALRRAAQGACGGQVVPPSRMDDPRASVRPRRQAPYRSAVFGRFQLFAHGDHG